MMALNLDKHTATCPALVEYYSQALHKITPIIKYTCEECKKGRKCINWPYKDKSSCLTITTSDPQCGTIHFYSDRDLITSTTKYVNLTAKFCFHFTDTLIPCWVLTSVQNE
jgi:hypothetical protein